VVAEWLAECFQLRYSATNFASPIPTSGCWAAHIGMPACRLNPRLCRDLGRRKASLPVHQTSQPRAPPPPKCAKAAHT